MQAVAADRRMWTLTRVWAAALPPIPGVRAGGVSMRRRAFLGRVAGFGGLCGVGTAGYTWGVEPHWPEVVRRELPVESLPKDLDGAVLVQVSDLHVGPEVDDGYLVSCLRSVRDLRPDITVVTGDILTFKGGRGEPSSISSEASWNTCRMADSRLSRSWAITTTAGTGRIPGWQAA